MLRDAIKTIGKVIGIVVALLILLVVCRIVSFQPYKIRDIRIENGVVVSDSKITKEKINPIDINISNNSEITEIYNLKIIYNGNPVKLEDRVYEKSLRYYISIDDIVKSFSKELKDVNKYIYIGDTKVIDINAHSLNIDGNEQKLRGEILKLNNKTYICLNDLESMLGLRLHWNFEANLIYIFNEQKDLLPKLVAKDGDKVALMRLEDVTAGGIFSKSENIEKFKVIGDFLYSQGIKFHIAWIPRYINPQEGIDNDLLVNKSIENVAFINMLDHLIYRGASIGLHGYTHQIGDTISAEGNELTYKDNNSKEDVIKIAENSLKIAKELNIPIDFFESPHYKATRNEQKILENYFEIMYEPYARYWNMMPLISLNNKSTIYIPAPLKRVKDDNGKELCNNLIKNPKWRLASFFIHPYKELNFIKFESIDENGYIEYEYDENSLIHNIVNTLNKNNYITIHVNDLIS